MITLFSILLVNCSDNPESYAPENIAIAFRMDPEPLLSNVRSACLFLTDLDTTTIYDTSFNFSPSIDNPAVITISGNIPTAFAVRAWFYDASYRPLYYGLETGGAGGNTGLNIVLNMSQIGLGSAIDVKILRDLPPWDSYALDTTLAGIGLSAGSGGGRYYIYSSGDFAILQPDPINDLLIISNDQPQQFYDLLAININVLREFASRGGTILWETCDMAWNYGSYPVAGIDSFPGGISQNTLYDFINLKMDGDLLLTKGLDDTLSGNYASNKYFAGVPDSAIIYMKDSGGNPTLLALKYGYGTIFYSGQPLEYNFDRRNDFDAGLLLPRITGFILGRTSTKSFQLNSETAESNAN